MAKLKQEDIIKAIEEMSVMELAELVKTIEDKFGVSSAPIAATVQTTAGEESKEGEKSEQTTFNVVLKAIGENKISPIKAVRELVPTLGLQDAKALVESAPKEVLTGVNKETAQEAKKKLESAGATVELK